MEPLTPTVKNHFRDAGLSEFRDPAEYCSASYWPDRLANLEPLSDHATPYREAAIGCLKVLSAMDDFLAAADDKRAAWIAVAIVLKLTSVRGLTVANIPGQLGCSPTTIKRYTTKFSEMADLDSDGGVQFIGNGAGSNGDNPTSIQA